MVPGLDEAITDIEKKKVVAREIGFILIKASAGGGGKGMSRMKRSLNPNEKSDQRGNKCFW
jgi:acetyl/propionyl-CoA carboxylase alpha subunit